MLMMQNVKEYADAAEFREYINMSAWFVLCVTWISGCVLHGGDPNMVAMTKFRSRSGVPTGGWGGADMGVQNPPQILKF
jgi:hypothetical protein